MSNHGKRYIGSLDGLRALAIILVVAYHLNLPFAQGGFIGVDIFFVLSGYLITCHLLMEWREKQTIDWKQFWLKRIRRLIPAVFFMVIVVLVLCFFVFPESFSRSKGDGVAAFFYVSNWWYIIEKIPYFDTFGIPTPLKHLWSLAIEEQFYVFWPVVLLGLLKLLKKRQHVLKVIVTTAIGSAILMGVLYTPNNVDRVYYGTDTRLFALLIGCSLAFLWPYTYLKDTFSKKTSRIMDSIGIIAFVALLGFSICLTYVSPFLYHGGFVLVALLTAILVAVLVHPSSQLARVFSWKPFETIGKFSYSLYLWHFPVISLFTPNKIIGTFQPLLLITQLLLIISLAYFSYYFIENPIRKQGIVDSIKEIRKASRKAIQTSILVLGMIILLTGLLTMGKDLLISHQPPKEPATRQSKKVTPTKKKIQIHKILVLGDSVAEGAKPELIAAIPGITVDAKIGRQLVDAGKLVNEKYTDYTSKDTLVFIELGSNSPFNSKDLEGLVHSLDKANIYLINTRVPRNWESTVNTLLDEASRTFDNVGLIDWHTTALNNPNLLEEDGIHLNKDGVQTYVDLIRKEMSNYDVKIE